MKKISGGLLFRLSFVVFSIITVTLIVILLIFVFIMDQYRIHFARNIDFLGIRISTVTLFFSIGVTSIMISLVISLFILRLYLKPINDLKVAMNEVSKGKFEILKEQSETKEMNELIVSYNKMVRELKHMETLGDDYTASISHEFKTPLATIKGYLDLLEMEDISNEEKGEYISIIRSANERLIGLTNNILLLNKIGNKEIISIESFQLDNQIRDAIILLEGKWSKKNINIDVELDEFEIESNAELVMSIWSNIISNAIKFTKENGNIKISLKTLGEKAIVSISDDGIGIGKEHIGNIFNKFYQIDKSPKIEGNGLGLSLVKGIVDKLKGKIEVESELNKGTTFTVTLNKKSY